MRQATKSIAGIDWAEHWRQLVRERAAATSSRHDPSYWDRRAPSFARTTRARVDDFLAVVAPYTSARKTLIDVGAGAGRHSLPLAERLEWVTAVEPSEGMRALIPPRDNMTLVASAWEEAEVAQADLVICCHVLYGVEDSVGFITKMVRSARERVFIMLREGPLPHPATIIRERMLGGPSPRLPQFSDLFMLLIQMGIAPEVTFIRYPIVHRYASVDEALTEFQSYTGAGCDEEVARGMFLELMTQEGDELVFDAGHTVSGIAHWHPLTS
jgi:SAM-dependent methyltransferase